MKIGIDFDNTIVCYDEVFHRAAADLKLIPKDVSVSKGHVRDFLRSAGNEDKWTELQGRVYGVYIEKAPPFPGVVNFFKKCRKSGIRILIISHKTRFPFIGDSHDLHAAARKWLEDNGFIGNEFGISREDVHFELTKQGKIDRIASSGCTHFIDDLPEFLKEQGFPGGVKRILFDPNDMWLDDVSYQRSRSWQDISGALL